MTIAVNTRLLISNKLEGIGWFTFQLFQRIAKNNPQHKFLFLFDRKWSPEFLFADNVIPIKLNPPTRHPVLWHWWFNISVPRILKKYDVKLFVSPDGFLSLNTDVPSLQVIHDLNFEHYPEFVKESHGKYYRKYFPQFARKASRIATVSRFSKDDIVKTYGINEDKIDVVYNDSHHEYKSLNEGEKQKVKNVISGGNDYFVFVSAFNPRKNIANLLKAFKQFKEKNISNHKLVMVGEKQYWTPEMEEALEESNKDDIVFTGRLIVEDLSKVMASATALVYASRFEGFGIPIVEAMRCGIPVITSNVSSMPEIAGRAALLVNPDSVNEISEAMGNITKDDLLRNNLIKAGFERASFFSWDKSAELLWNSMLKILEA